MKRVIITTLGCKVNQFESASFHTAFAEAGCEIIKSGKDVDVVVINTCAVTSKAGAQSRQAVRQAIRTNPAARIIALTIHRQEQYMLDAVRAGARGYLLKSVDAGELIAAIEAVYRDDYLIDPIIAARVLFIASETEHRQQRVVANRRRGSIINAFFVRFGFNLHRQQLRLLFT